MLFRSKSAPAEVAEPVTAVPIHPRIGAKKAKVKKDLLVKKVIDMLYDEAKVKEVDSLTAKEADEAGNGKPAEATEDKGKAGAKKAKKKAGNKGEFGTGKDTE